jgi:hypothetical protein
MERETLKTKEAPDSWWPDALVQIIHEKNIGRYLIKKSEELARLKVQRKGSDL